jgi:hypothetical protein
MGPTIPFVLGAIQVPIGRPIRTEAIAKDNLRELLKALREAPKGHGVRIQWCLTTRAHVVTANPFVEGLDWEALDGCVPPNLDGLFDVLWERYGTFILAGDYSIDDLVWHPFTPDEVKKIEETLADGCLNIPELG